MASALLSRSGFVVATGLLVFAGGFVAGGKMTAWRDVAPLETEVEELDRQLTSCGDNEARLRAALERMGVQARALADECAARIDQADQAAWDALLACEDLREDATIEEWNAWLAACSPSPP